ncbi:MAG: DUF454 family protein [Kiritimatiellales bacterium]
MKAISNPLHRGLWLLAGLFFLLLGLIGLAIPLFPQTPFLLAAVFCFMRMSKRLDAWIRRQRWFICFHDKLCAWQAKRRK